MRPRERPGRRLVAVLVVLLLAGSMAGCASASAGRPDPTLAPATPAASSVTARPGGERTPAASLRSRGTGPTPAASSPVAPPRRGEDATPDAAVPASTRSSGVADPSAGSGGAGGGPALAGGSTPPTLAPAATPFVQPTTFDERTRRTLQRLVDRARERANVPGLAIAVRLPSGETWTALSGDAQLTPARPLTDDTVFAIASVTKTFIAALVMQLAEEKRLGLDDPLSRYVPDAPRAGRVTIRQLLSHWSGLNDYFTSRRYNKEVFADPDHRWTYDEIMALVGPAYCAPGACYHYSNTNYVLLGRVVEAVTGQPIAEVLRTRLFDPLGLDHTVYQPDEPTPADAAHGHWAYAGGFTDHTGDQAVIPTLSAASVAGPAGAIAASAADLARWAAALYGGEILSRASIRDMETVRSPDGYGMGTRRVVFFGHEAFGHRGSLRGFESSMWYFPKEGVSIALLSNRGLWRTDQALKPLVLAVLGPRQGRTEPSSPARTPPSPDATGPRSPRPSSTTTP